MRRHFYRIGHPGEPISPRPQDDSQRQDSICRRSRPEDQPGVLWRMFDRAEV